MSKVTKSVINFLSSVPVYIFTIKLDMPEIVATLLLFGYWILAGGILGFLLGCKKPSLNIIALAFVIALLALHYKTSLCISRDLETAVKSFGNFFTCGMLK